MAMIFKARGSLISLMIGLSLWLGAGAAPSPAAAAPSQATAPSRLRLVSFNIQFLGQFRQRDNAALAEMLSPYDLIFVQELVAPPYPGVFPDGEAFRPDPEAAAFFDAMRAKGFAYVLSEEDTGSGPQRHVNSSATEWFVAFYKPHRLVPAVDLPSGFLAADRYDHPDYERTPYAFGFRSGSEDLVFISVHLQPGGGAAATRRRAQELGAIHDWIDGQTGAERDFVILGDMNIEDCDELEDVVRVGWVSLNSECRPTNTNINGPKPYDHILLNTRDTRAEIPPDVFILDLLAYMEPRWSGPDAYPGRPYRHDRFRQIYSDHHPVVFDLIVDGVDDD